MAALLTPDRLAGIVQSIPGSWIPEDPGFAGTGEQREAYLNYFMLRLQSSSVWVEEAIRARTSNL
jgi:hypothetical protein